MLFDTSAVLGACQWLVFSPFLISAVELMQQSKIRKQTHFGFSFSLTQMISVIQFRMQLLKLYYMHNFGGDKMQQPGQRTERGIS